MLCEPGVPEECEEVQLPNQNCLLDEFVDHFFLQGLGACLTGPNAPFVTGELICVYWLLNITLEIVMGEIKRQELG